MPTYRRSSLACILFLVLTTLGGMVLTRLFERVPPGSSPGFFLAALPPILFSFGWVLLGWWVGNPWWRRAFVAGSILTVSWGLAEAYVFRGTLQQVTEEFRHLVQVSWLPAVLSGLTLAVLIWWWRKPGSDIIQSAAGALLVVAVPFCTTGLGFIVAGTYLQETATVPGPTEPFQVTLVRWLGDGMLRQYQWSLSGLLVIVVIVLAGCFRSSPRAERAAPEVAACLVPPPGTLEFSAWVLSLALVGLSFLIVYVEVISLLITQNLVKMSEAVGLVPPFPFFCSHHFVVAMGLVPFMAGWALLMSVVPRLGKPMAGRVCLFASFIAGNSFCGFLIGIEGMGLLWVMGVHLLLRGAWRMWETRDMTPGFPDRDSWFRIWDLLGFAFFGCLGSALLVSSGLAGSMPIMLAVGRTINFPTRFPALTTAVEALGRVDIGNFYLLSWTVPAMVFLVVVPAFLAQVIAAFRLSAALGHGTREDDLPTLSGRDSTLNPGLGTRSPWFRPPIATHGAGSSQIIRTLTTRPAPSPEGARGECFGNPTGGGPGGSHRRRAGSRPRNP